MAEVQLGRMQFRIMRVLWDRGRASARDITDAIGAGEPVAHSTVQTLLRQLEAKGAVGHEEQGRTFVFFPLLKEDKVKRTATRDLLERVFGGNVGSLELQRGPHVAVSAAGFGLMSIFIARSVTKLRSIG